MVSPAGQGGTIQYTHNLCDALVAEGHEVILATSIGCEMTPFPRDYELLEVFDRFTPHVGPLSAFVRRVRAFQPDVVHLQGAQRPEFYWLLLGVLRRLCKAAYIWTPQDIISNSAKPWHPWMQRRNYAAMRHVFLNARQNEVALRDLYGVGADRITVLPIPDLVAFARRDLPSVMPPEMAGMATEGPLILNFGLIEPRKGISVLIDAFARMLDSSDARLVIMGKPLMDAEALRQAVAQLNTDRIRLIPRYASFEEMNALFGAAHAVVLPYVSGWNSGVLSSAYGWGKPVIATRVGGFDEVVRDGETGLLVPPSDAEALASAMTQIASDAALHQRLSTGAAAEGEAASWAMVARQTSAVYAQVLGAQA